MKVLIYLNEFFILYLYLVKSDILVFFYGIDWNVYVCFYGYKLVCDLFVVFLYNGRF